MHVLQVPLQVFILSYPSALTPKKRKTRLAGKTRTYLWTCLLTLIPVTKILSGFTQVAYCMEKSVLVVFARLQTIDINGMSPNPITWR